MKRVLLASAVALTMAFASNVALAKDLPPGGFTVEDVAKWLQGAGYKAEIQTAKDGSSNVYSASDGVGFHVYMYDCKNGPRCGSIQFSVGFDTKGAWTAGKMNSWNSGNRWVRSYVDDANDPWVEMDVDLSPGGSWENLNDEFAVWRDMLGRFKQYINW